METEVMCGAGETCDPGTGECEPDSVRITAEGEAYGHHGDCSGWNGCGDAATCALWACEVNGYSELVSFGEDRPCTEFGVCHLFHSRGDIDWNWGNSCPVQGVTDIFCSGQGMQPAMEADAPAADACEGCETMAR
jgi:hypothetical protein